MDSVVTRDFQQGACPLNQWTCLLCPEIGHLFGAGGKLPLLSGFSDGDLRVVVNKSGLRERVWIPSYGE